MSGCAALALLLLAQATPVFRTGVEAVYVDVTVTTKGAPVLGLAAGDFVLTDNGVRQRVAIAGRDVVATTAVLVLDVSTSVAGRRLGLLRRAAWSFIRGTRERDEAALVVFNHKIALLQPPTTDRSLVADALERLEARGSTAVIDALYACLKRRWGGGRPVVVLFTDGRDTASWLENRDLLQAARESSALLYIVGTEATGPRFEMSPPTGAGPQIVRRDSGYLYLLQRTADITGGAYWSASYEHLEDAFAKVLEAANARYVLAYEPDGVTIAGRHRLKVSVKRKGVEVRARQEYFVNATPVP